MYAIRGRFSLLQVEENKITRYAAAEMAKGCLGVKLLSAET